MIPYFNQLLSFSCALTKIKQHLLLLVKIRFPVSPHYSKLKDTKVLREYFGIAWTLDKREGKEVFMMLGESSKFSFNALTLYYNFFMLNWNLYFISLPLFREYNIGVQKLVYYERVKNLSCIRIGGACNLLSVIVENIQCDYFAWTLHNYRTPGVIYKIS